MDFGPQVVWEVDTAGCTAFLSLELEGAADDAGDHFVHIGGAVRDDEVLATGLADNARVGLVLGNVLANGLPQVAEHAGGPGEVQSGEIGVGEDHVACGGTVDGHQIDDAFGQACGVQQLHDDVGGVDLVVRRLPHHHVAHEGSGNGQVARNGREVEWGDREDEAFQCAVLEAVPESRSAFRLLRVDLLSEMAIEPKEVDELTGGVDFGLM